MRTRTRSAVIAASSAIGLGLAVTVAHLGPSASAADRAANDVPRPIYATSGSAADPGLAHENGTHYAFMTGGRTKVASSKGAVKGPWTPAGDDALTDWGDWASGEGAVWAPDAVRTSAGWVLYYAAQAKGFDGQRCIGTAIADELAGPYEPTDRPLICPILNGEDPVAGRPVKGSGVIDPAPFKADDGKRFLLYKTQQAPGTIRMFPVSDDGLHARGGTSRELVRQADSIENPVMVQRGEHYILFASANWYDQCKYSTVWRRSTDRWSFADKPEHVLLDKANSGLCGPGGADLVNGAKDSSRLVFHGWVCSNDNTPCDFDGPVDDPDRRRVLYGAVVRWGEDNITPQVTRFLEPVS